MIKINLVKGDFLKTSNGRADLIVTSPPYAIGKSYDESVDLDAAIDHMDAHMTNGVICWQVGNRIENGFVNPIDIITHESFLKRDWKLLNRIVWTFGHGLHCKNRFSGRYETVMVYTKGDHKFNLDPVRVPQKYPGKKHFKGPKKGQLSGNPLGKNPGDVWDIPNVKNNHPEKTAHPCQFPEELARRLILAFSDEGDTVMDPFMGSGTVGAVAKELGRNFVGIEMSDTFMKIAKNRIEAR